MIGTGRIPAIRPARPGDAAEIARLAGELGYPATAQEIQERLRVLLADGRHIVAVAAAQGAGLQGWIAAEHRVSLDAGERAEIMGLVVGPGARRAGVGRALVAAAERWAAERGLTAVTVRSNVLRAESHPFYERLGYARSKTQHCYRKHVGAAPPADPARPR